MFDMLTDVSIYDFSFIIVMHGAKVRVAFSITLSFLVYKSTFYFY